MPSTELTSRLHNQEDADIFAGFEQIHDCTNQRFFDGQLDPVGFSFTRNSRCKGALQLDRYMSVDGKVMHGMTVNSEYCQTVGDAGTMTLLASLLVHQARHDLGPEGRNGSRGTPGNIDSWKHKVLAGMGIETFVEDSDEERQLGYGLSFRAVEGGPFDLMCRELLVSGFKLRWRENAANFDPETGEAKSPPPEAKPQTRVCYECPECGLKALAKPTALLACGVCNLAMPPAETGK